MQEIIDKYEGKKVLLLGDGISQIYAKNMFADYDYVISVNQSLLLNSKLPIGVGVCHIVMEPSLLTLALKGFICSKFRREYVYRASFPRKFRNGKFDFLVAHPYGALLKGWLFGGKKTFLCSPYSRIKLGKNSYYNDFTAAFQAALGIAMAMGFRHLDIVGFDAWLLTPQNHSRWYSNVDSPRMGDVEAVLAPPEFLSIAASHCSLRTFVYGHYTSRYSFIKPIPTPEWTSPYSPKRDRHEFLSKQDYIELSEWENYFYPNGYGK